jgi:Lrp/AsnC family leucine-responsive transcriptional regulator
VIFPDSAANPGEAPAILTNDSPMTRDDLDGFDLAILRILRLEGRLSIAELAERIRLSKSPTQARLRRLERAGFITGYQARLDHVRLGQGHVVFVEVKLSDTREHALGAFNAAVRALPAIEECHMIAGAFDYLLKVRSADIHAYRRILADQISALPHVAATSTHVAMEAVKEAGA